MGRLGLGAPAKLERCAEVGYTATEEQCVTVPQRLRLPAMEAEAGAGAGAESVSAALGSLSLSPSSAGDDCTEPLAAAVSCGDFHTAVLCRQGFAYTCGRGEYGRLGHGDAEDCWVPRRVEALAHTRLVRVSCGESHTVLADAAGVVYSCGSNRAGALGLGDTADRLAPEVRCFCCFHNLSLQGVDEGGAQAMETAKLLCRRYNCTA